MQKNTPILVGSGQYVDRAKPDPATSLSPADIAATAARRALSDTGATGDLGATVDAIAVARLFEHSVRDRVMWPNPYGCSNNLPRSVANRLGLSPQRAIYAEVGGETPQRLVNQMAAAIHRGELRSVLLAGAEALATIRHGQRAGIELNWHEEVAGDFEDLWPDAVMASEYEIRHGIALPIHVYALFEQARSHALGYSAADTRAAIGELFAPFSSVAAGNPYAQFPQAWTATDIAAVSDSNYLLCEPYCKRMVAQDAVNQGAAVVMTSVGLAQELGISEAHWIYLEASADVDELPVVERPDLGRSPAQHAALHHVLDTAQASADAIDFIDLYSCFPIAVTCAAESLGLDPSQTALTLTGGLPFFGGPGNNYSLHAIAEVVARLRGREGRALVAANGGYLSKHSVGLYSRQLKGEWQPCSSAAAVERARAGGAARVSEVATGTGRIESYAAVYQRGAPAGGFIVGRLDNDDSRFLARAREGDAATLALLFSADPIGRRVNVSHADNLNLFSAA